MNDNLIVLDLPANREYIAVLRCALGGVAIAGDLNVDQLDDLRSAADEAFDSIINQNACIDRVEMRATIQPHSSLSV